MCGGERVKGWEEWRDGGSTYSEHQLSQKHLIAGLLFPRALVHTFWEMLLLNQPDSRCGIKCWQITISVIIKKMNFAVFSGSQLTPERMCVQFNPANDY